VRRLAYIALVLLIVAEAVIVAWALVGIAVQAADFLWLGGSGLND